MGQGQMWEERMCLQLCGTTPSRHPREQEGKGWNAGVPAKSMGNSHLASAACPNHARCLMLNAGSLLQCLLPLSPGPPHRVRCLGSPPSGSHASPVICVCPSVLPLLSVHLSTAFQPSPSSSLSLCLAPSSLPQSSPLFLWCLSACTSPSLSSFPSLRPALTPPSFELFPSCCSFASLLPSVSSFPSLVFLVSTLPVCLSLGFFSCVLLCASFSVRLSLHLPPPPSLSLCVRPFPLAHLLRVSPLGLLPPRAPFSPGGAPVWLRGPHSLPPSGGERGTAGGPSAGRRAFFLPPALTLPPPTGLQPTPPHAAAPPGPGSLAPPWLRGGGAPRRPQKLLCKKAGRGAGPRGLWPSRRRGAGGPPGTLPPPPSARRPPAQGLPGSPLPPASRPRAPRASSTHKCQRTAAAPMLTAGRAVRAGVRGARTPPTGRSASARSCWFRGQRSGSQSPSRRG